MKFRFIGGALDGEEQEAVGSVFQEIHAPFCVDKKVLPVNQALDEAIKRLNGEAPRMPLYSLEHYRLRYNDGNLAIYDVVHTEIEG
ncbi:MAG TPA: hypothetical protein VJS44_08360 [Pyrinomonadaceae bacterium]|nr:hypothetical protein [Pyrinomonadaceae bacterium]